MRIAIVHHGEDVPSDSGYVALRYGRLARALVNRGDSVVRISPSFSHLRREQRSNTHQDCEEGRIYIVQTASYKASISIARARFLLQFLRGAARFLRENRTSFDLVIVGIPPPGIVLTTRLAIGQNIPIVGDVRDLWPNAIAVGPNRRWAGFAAFVGKLVSLELFLANRIIAVTSKMLQWAPSARQHSVVPIGLPMREISAKPLLENEVGLRVCFLSTHTHPLDFSPVLLAWQSYISTVGSGSILTFIGGKPPQSFLNMPSVRWLGMVETKDVGNLLTRQDVGIYPASKEWEYSLGNKIFDYFSCGLYVLHTLDPKITKQMDGMGLARRCDRSESSWLTAFLELHEKRIDLRNERAKRATTAEYLYGRKKISEMFANAIDDLVV